MAGSESHESDRHGALTVIHVRDGMPAASESWLYVWLSLTSRSVIYVGGTGLSPQTRTWLHLNHPDPEIGRIAALYPGISGEPFDVLAMPLPEEHTRPVARAELIRQLDSLGMLGAGYVGFAPEAASQPVADSLRQHVRLMVERIRAW